jgi:hypothetical protein
MRYTIHRTSLPAALVTVCAVMTVGCSDDATGPDGTGNGFMQAIVTDNPNSESPTASVSPLFRISGSSQGAAYEGTISGQMRVSISADGETWYDLGSLNGIAVQAQSTVGGTNVHGEVTIAAGTYNRVRLVLRNATATIEAGAEIGGITLTTDVDVALGDGTDIVIEKEVETFTVTAEATARTEILFDLNSEAWITLDNVEQGEAPADQVEESCRTETREAAREEQT